MSMLDERGSSGVRGEWITPGGYFGCCDICSVGLKDNMFFYILGPTGYRYLCVVCAVRKLRPPEGPKEQT